MVSTGIKRKRSTYCAGFKPKVVEFAEEKGNRAAEREFSVSFISTSIVFIIVIMDMCMERNRIE